jgi:L-aminopeptidase/D-esterase-like protein
MSRFITQLIALALASASTQAQQQPRARDLGIPFDGTPGPLNAITDVAGVEVGHVTLISGSGPVVPGKGPVRTGVTAILPRGRNVNDAVFGGWFTLNGNGEMTGTTWVEESGFLEGPVLITNTHNVGVVRDAAAEWMISRGYNVEVFALPVVAETFDVLNDVNGFHVRREHALAALDSAKPGPVREGAVGGGTGMICHGFKGGIGTSSRRVGDFTIGVLVQCNYGSTWQLRIAGIPVGREIKGTAMCIEGTERPSRPWVAEWITRRCDQPAPPGARENRDEDRGSIIVVIGTDAPLLPHQMKRIATRATLGIARMGGVGGNSSGDIFIAFSTANRGARQSDRARIEMIANDAMTGLFEATAQATEEAIVNALVAARTMTGADNLRVYALPHDQVVAILRKHQRHQQAPSSPRR